jgi:phosphohistidine phosphatase
MRLLLIRHARAAASQHLPDAERPLTDEGRREFLEVARSIVQHGGTPELIYHSPARRTTETADILAAAAQVPAHARVLAPWLAIGSGCQQVVTRLTDLSTEFTALVGHEPIMSTLTALLLGRGGSTFSPGASLCLEFDSTIFPGQGRLLWALEP